MKKYSKEWTLLGVLVLVIIVLSLLPPYKFFTATNFKSMVVQMPELGLFTLAMFVTILTGGINLSVITTGTVSGIVSATVLSTMHASGADTTLSIILAVLALLACSIICGILNGYVVSYIGAAAMMATLGTSTLFTGIGLLISKGNSISGFPTEFFWIGNGTLAGIPVPMIIFLIIAVLTFILLERTPWGFSVYMVGSNPKASLFSGIKVKKVTMLVYIYSALLGGIAMIIMMSRYNSARIDYGSSYLMETVAASVLGGAAITGGYGKVAGVVAAVAILQCLSSGLNIFGLQTSLSEVITGLLLITVLTINFFTTRYGKSSKISKKDFGTQKVMPLNK